MCSCDKYELAEKQLKSFTRSKIRTTVLLCLKDEDKNVGELEKEIGSRNTTILHAIKDMSDADLITRSSNGYHLTNLGKMQAHLLDYLVNFVISLDEHRSFWLNHDISGIPNELLHNIGMLAQSDIVEYDFAAPLEGHEYFVTELLTAKELHGLSPILLAGYPDAIATAVKKGAQVDLILTKSVLEILSTKYSSLVRDLLGYNNFKLYQIGDDIKIAFTVTDNYLSIGMYRLDGFYDLTADLNLHGKNAARWGMELFNYYLKKSELVASI